MTSNSRRVRRLALLLPVMLVAAACGSDDEGTSTTSPPVTTPAATTATTTGGSTATSTGGSAAPTTKAPTTTAKKLPLERTKIGVAAAAQSAALMSTYIADRQGFFKAEGLDVTVTPYAGASAALTAVVTDVEQVYIGGFPTQLNLLGTPNQTVVLDETMSIPSTSFFAQKDIKSWKDIADKGGTVGVSSIGGMDHQLALFVLKKDGIDASKIKFQAAGAATARNAALQAGSLMATSSTLTSGFQLIDLGFNELGKMTDYLKDYPLEVMAVTKTFAEKNPGVAQALIRADRAAADWTMKPENKAAAIAHINAQLNTPAAEVKYLEQGWPEYMRGLANTGYSIEGYRLVTESALEDGKIDQIKGKKADEIIKAFIPQIPI